MSEEWRAVVGWEGFYEVSDLGRVRSLPMVKRGKNNGKIRQAGRVRKLQVPSNGYPMLSLKVGDREENALVHRLVAAAFLGPANGLCVNHRDGIRSNNVISNLEYLTHQQNERHKYVVLKYKHHLGKLCAADVVEIRRQLAGGVKVPAVAAAFGVSDVNIYLIRSGKIWKHVA